MATSTSSPPRGRRRLLDELIHEGEIAAKCGVTRQTIVDWGLRDEVPYVLKGRTRMYRKSAVERWLRDDEYRPSRKAVAR